MPLPPHNRIAGALGKFNANAQQMLIDWFGSVEGFKESHRDIGDIRNVFDRFNFWKVSANNLIGNPKILYG